jgi:hypothetical protein
MRDKLGHIGGYLLSIAGSLGLLYVLLDRRLFYLGSQMLAGGGDSLKNAFTPAYLYKWDEGVWHTAMNYPYGDFAVYTDAQVGLVMILRLLRAIGIDSEQHALLIIQGLPVLSFVIGAVLLYKLSRHFQMPVWWSVLVSLSCIAFSPHIYRHVGHFGLAYAFVIPAYWLYLLQCVKWRWWQTIAVGASMLLLSAYLHPYWILILTVFTMSYVLVDFFFTKTIKWLPLLVSIGSIGSVLLLNTLLDPVGDRPAHPYGLLSFNTQVRSLFSPHGFIHDLVTPLLSSRVPNFEGYAYIGPLLYALMVGFILFLILQRKRWHSLQHLGIPLELRISFVASLLVLLFAAGIHVEIGNGIILEWISPLQQFRSLGRFAWVFCNVGAIWAGVVTYRLVQMLPWQWLRVAFFAATLTLVVAESYQWLAHRNQQIDKWAVSSNWLESQTTLSDLLTASNRQPQDYQAIITLPPAIEGSEKVGKEPRYHVKRHVLPFVYQTGIPTTMSCMSRTSLSQTLNLLQIGSGSHVEKRWAKDLPSDQPLLVAIEPRDTLVFSDLLTDATLLGVQDHICLYETQLGDWQTVDYLTTDRLPISKDNIGYALNLVEDGNAEGIFGTKGQELSKEEHLLLTCPVDIDTSTTAHASAWFRVEPDDRSIAILDLAAYDASGTQLWRHGVRYAQDHRYEIHDDWYRIDQIREIDKSVKTLKLFAIGAGLQVDQGLITIDTIHPVIPINEDYWQVGHSIYPLAE